MVKNNSSRQSLLDDAVFWGVVPRWKVEQIRAYTSLGLDRDKELRDVDRFINNKKKRK